MQVGVSRPKCETAWELLLRAVCVVIALRIPPYSLTTPYTMIEQILRCVSPERCRNEIDAARFGISRYGDSLHTGSFQKYLWRNRHVCLPHRECDLPSLWR